MIRTIPVLLSMLSIFACRPSPNLSEDERLKITEDVRKTLSSYYDAIRDSGLAAEFKYLDKSAEFYWVPPGFTYAISYDSVTAIIKQNASFYTLVDNSFDTLSIRPLNREYAIYTGRLRSRMTDTAGLVTTFSLIESGVMIKRRDGWKLLSGQTSILH